MDISIIYQNPEAKTLLIVEQIKQNNEELPKKIRNSNSLLYELGL